MGHRTAQTVLARAVYWRYAFVVDSYSLKMVTATLVGLSRLFRLGHTATAHRYGNECFRQWFKCKHQLENCSDHGWHASARQSYPGTSTISMLCLTELLVVPQSGSVTLSEFCVWQSCNITQQLTAETAGGRWQPLPTDDKMMILQQTETPTVTNITDQPTTYASRGRRQPLPITGKLTLLQALATATKVVSDCDTSERQPTT
jgi:hypothetical protein